MRWPSQTYELSISGQFSTQTCFQGRFGEETGSNQFGATIMVNQLDKDTQVAQAHLAYVEISHAGQAFRIGRYAVHFHLNGDMSQSYVRGCSIHDSFNRAITLHGVHNMDITWNVAYNIMGNAMFLEDGIETGNTFDHNLVVFTKGSSSLLNKDITPAAFWITNPDNSYSNNVAAGGSHLGFWYQLNAHPTGPSFVETICPKNIPLRLFADNTAHSNGWYGLWVFEEMVPTKNGNCGASEETSEPALFKRFNSLNNNKGAELAISGALQFNRSAFVQNKETGLDVKRTTDIKKRSSEYFCGITQSVIVGFTRSLRLRQESTKRGLVMPFGYGARSDDNLFMNIVGSDTAAVSWTRIPGQCTANCGGWPAISKAQKYDNVTNRVRFESLYEAILEDVDGSVCDDGPWKILPLPGTILPPDICLTCEWCAAPPLVEVEAVKCPYTMRFHTMAFKVSTPKSLSGKDFSVKNKYGIAFAPYLIDTMWPYNPGYHLTLVDGEKYYAEFENGEQLTNISWVGEFTEFSVSKHLDQLIC